MICLSASILPWWFTSSRRSRRIGLTGLLRAHSTDLISPRGCIAGVKIQFEHIRLLWGILIHYIAAGMSPQKAL